MISIVIPYYNAAETIQRTLNSLCGAQPFAYEVLVVDDGSAVPLMREALEWNDDAAPLTLVRVEPNGGKAAACNRGFAATKGDAVIVLDADDEMPPEWGAKMGRLMEAWPIESPLAFAWAVTERGESTGSGSGCYAREQWLAGEGRGEYLPVFRGCAAREKGYLTPGCRKICGTLSYARLLEDGPLYIHPETLRIYHTGTEGSITKQPFARAKAQDSYRCFHAARVSIEAQDRRRALPAQPYLADLYLREAVYQMFGQSRGQGLSFAWRNRAHIGARKLAVLTVLSVLPRGVCAKLLTMAKRRAVVAEFG